MLPVCGRTEFGKMFGIKGRRFLSSPPRPPSYSPPPYFSPSFLAHPRCAPLLVWSLGHLKKERNRLLHRVKMGVRIPCMCTWWDPTKSVLYQCFFSYYSGVLYNIRYTIPACSFNELLQAVVKVLAQVLDVNCFDVIGKLLPEPTKVKSNLLWCTHNFSWEIHAKRILSSKRSMSQNTSTCYLSDHWSKDLLFEHFISLVFCFCFSFLSNICQYSSCTFMWAFVNRANFTLLKTGQTI